MKKTLLIAFLALTFLVGCKKDDELTGSETDRIQGRWDLSKSYFLDKKNGVKTDEGTENYSVGYYYITFSGNTFKSFESGQLDDEGTFTISNSKITLDYGGNDKDDYEISWVSNIQFVFKSSYSYSQGSDAYVSMYEETFNKN